MEVHHAEAMSKGNFVHFNIQADMLLGHLRQINCKYRVNSSSTCIFFFNLVSNREKNEAGGLFYLPREISVLLSHLLSVPFIELAYSSKHNLLAYCRGGKWIKLRHFATVNIKYILI